MEGVARFIVQLHHYHRPVGVTIRPDHLVHLLEPVRHIPLVSRVQVTGNRRLKRKVISLNDLARCIQYLKFRDGYQPVRIAAVGIYRAHPRPRYKHHPKIHTLTPIPEKRDVQAGVALASQVILIRAQRKPPPANVGNTIGSPVPSSALAHRPGRGIHTKELDLAGYQRLVGAVQSQAIAADQFQTARSECRIRSNESRGVDRISYTFRTSKLRCRPKRQRSPPCGDLHHGEFLHNTDRPSMRFNNQSAGHARDTFEAQKK